MDSEAGEDDENNEEHPHQHQKDNDEGQEHPEDSQVSKPAINSAKP